jgi:hypothetical protein
MYYRFILFISILINFAYATDVPPLASLSESNTPSTNPGLSEAQKLNKYDSLVGDAPKGVTISNTGAAFEMMENAAQYYAFFSQTLSNGIYYEVRAYTRQNYLSQNPLVTIPVSTIQNPWGYGGVFKLGYNFHLGNDLDLTPYLRFNASNNMGPVYADQFGDYIDSQTYSYFLGSKLAFKVLPKFTPYIDIFGGYQQVPLQGAFPGGPIGSADQITGNIDQFQITYEIGMGIKLMDHLALIPYWQYITQANWPNQTALNTVNQGGFGISPFTGTQQVFALKLNLSW